MLMRQRLTTIPATSETPPRAFEEAMQNNRFKRNDTNTALEGAMQITA
jgi:hypothetical protein